MSATVDARRPTRAGAWESSFAAMVRAQVLVVMSRRMNLTTGIASPLLWLALVLGPHLHAGGQESAAVATRSVTGVLLASFWSSSLWSGAGIIRRERSMGTLAVSFTGRIPPIVVLLGKTLGGVLYDTALMVVTITGFVLVERVHLAVASPLALGVGLASVVVGGVASSLMIGALLMLSRHAFQLTTAVGAPVLLFAGTIVPHALLPHWVEVVGWVLNISWLQRFLASSATGPRWSLWVVAMAITAVYGLIGGWALGVLLRRARKDATLELG